MDEEFKKRQSIPTMEDDFKKRQSITDVLQNSLQKILISDRVKKGTCSDEEHLQLQRKTLTILMACHVGAFVQSLGSSMQHTAFPYLTKQLGVTPQVYGYIISFNAMLQLLGGVVCGRLSDIYGGRFTLIISFLTLGMGYMILSVSTNVTLLFLSRLPTFAAHALQSMYVIISDVTYVKERADMIGKLGASHGLGMIVGSVTGGFVTEKFGIRPTFVVAVVFMGICICITASLIPADTKAIHLQLTAIEDEKEDTKDTKEILEKSIDRCSLSAELKPEQKEKEKSDDKVKIGSFMGVREFIVVGKLKHMMYLLTIKSVAAFPFGVLSAMFTLLLMDFYKLGPRQNGMVLAYLGVVGMVTQGCVVGLLARHARDDTLILLSTLLMCVGFLFLIISDSIYIFCVVAIPLTVGGSLIHIIITSLITKITPKNLNGSALGLTSCTHATIRSVAPSIGGFLFQHVGFYSFGVLGYVFNLLLSIYLMFLGRTNLTDVEDKT